MMKYLFLSAAFIFISVFGFAQTSPPTSNTDTSKAVSFAYVEKMPECPGGIMSYINKNLRYPAKEKKQKIGGTVYVSFVVEKDGSISNVHAVKEVAGAPGLTLEAIRLITTMPKWIPGEMNGHPVRIEITQPIRFILQ